MVPHACERPRRDKQGGFSFIEILIVMGIIGVLVGGVVFAIGIWGRKGPIFETKNRVRAAAQLIHSWKQRFDLFPPGDVRHIGKTIGQSKLKALGAANPTNRGIESVMQALKVPGFSAGHDWGANEIGNADEDKLDKAIATDGNPDLIELFDAWGNPLVYFSNDEYDEVGEGGRMIMLGPESETAPGEEISVVPWRDENGRYLNSETFQLFSIGPDGEPNTEDDIGNWNAD